MKRFTALLLTSVYLMASIGVSVNIHYCGGKIAHVKLFTGADCPCGGEFEKPGCCSDETLVFQLDDEQHTVSHNFDLSLVFVSPAQQARPDAREAPPELKTKINPAFLDLPPPPELPLCIQYCSLTYYG